jgi:hypothetical protein
MIICNLCNEPLSDNNRIPALYDCNHTVCDQCYFKNILQCPFCGMLNVDNTLKINITLADLINNFTKLLQNQINPQKEESKLYFLYNKTS